MLLPGGLYRLVVRVTPLAKVQIIQLLHNCILASIQLNITHIVNHRYRINN